ncbi:MAG TPA: flagellar hook-basal body complex protein [candidate division Zixibacteria bacterium]|nr:flagellar hook-basal body complex protein [candidate division Zixibacteria bacterium]MDD4916814.1 flagellar hook-basal body complex protein [candidate division Zixibacteria bacterium]MDM7973415.1 flagellar hook-basal body complex protein [candidate division Zixibacteria bacterium]HOD65184.1 flagellar hook-basal body complex protein [candidate division Zixibacteria bacterium]HOZ06710.1 flagellar hook-basal body complex protein [candidate division Zixibacteria bacterium]
MMASLYAGVSGLKNHQVKMNVIGNNIANINTVGFKTSRVNFQEALVQTFKGAGRPSAITGGTNPVQLGLGMEVASIDNLFQQGGLETTGQILDLAIQGSGFFILGDANGNRFYTRAGAFGLDSQATLVDPSNGLYVLGRMADNTGQIPSLATTGPIRLPFGQQDPANATEEIWLSANLDASASDANAALVESGDSNVLLVSGTALDGVGGTHRVSITGDQAIADTVTSATAGMTGAQTLGALGVTDFSDFSLTIDGARTETISGLSATTTVEELIASLNQIAGVSASLDGSGAITIMRTRAGDHATYNIVSSPAGAGDVLNTIFGAGLGATVATSGGADTTLVATDTFTPLQGSGTAGGPFVTQLGLVVDERTGLVTGLSGLGDGGVEITAGQAGIGATNGNDLVIDTESTTHTASITVFDSQGGRHTLSIEFFRSALTNRWEWSVATLGTETVLTGGSGYVQFNPDGSLNSFAYNGGNEAITINPNNGAENMEVVVNPGTAFSFDGLTGFASGTHTASIVRQDGYGVGILEKIAIDKAGNISGIFNNGVTRLLAQVMLSDFFNQSGLRKAGKSMYQESANSGSAVEGVAGQTISGQIFSGALESSAVDIAQEFTGMITAQRGFQANARVITTSDNMLDELVNIKR